MIIECNHGTGEMRVPYVYAIAGLAQVTYEDLDSAMEAARKLALEVPGWVSHVVISFAQVGVFGEAAKNGR